MARRIRNATYPIPTIPRKRVACGPTSHRCCERYRLSSHSDCGIRGQYHTDRVLYDDRFRCYPVSSERIRNGDMRNNTPACTVHMARRRTCRDCPVTEIPDQRVGTCSTGHRCGERDLLAS